MHIILLAGGKGKRLWPISNDNNPKPFIKIKNNFSLFQLTYLRCLGLKSISSITIIANSKFIGKLQKEIEELNIHSINFIKKRFFAEKEGRCTAAAITMAAIYIGENFNKNDKLLILPIDHIIDNEANFHLAITQAQNLADQNKLVTFGVIPDKAEINYGYIKYSGTNVEKFIEKPNLANAEFYVKNGQYLWNSGIFCFKSNVFIDEMSKHAPDILQASINCIAQSSLSNKNDYIEIVLHIKLLALIRKSSIDYALMEKSDNIAVVVGNFDWLDIGNWNSYIQYLEKSMVAIKNNMIKIFPWGMKQFFNNNSPIMTKITINPGQSFSMPGFFIKKSHWMILSGIARITNNNMVDIFSQNSIINFEHNSKKNITNIGKLPLIILTMEIDAFLQKNDIMDNKNYNDHEKISML